MVNTSNLVENNATIENSYASPEKIGLNKRFCKCDDNWPYPRETTTTTVEKVIRGDYEFTTEKTLTTLETKQLVVQKDKNDAIADGNNATADANNKASNDGVEVIDLTKIKAIIDLTKIKDTETPNAPGNLVKTEKIQQENSTKIQQQNSDMDVDSKVQQPQSPLSEMVTDFVHGHESYADYMRERVEQELANRERDATMLNNALAAVAQRTTPSIASSSGCTVPKTPPSQMMSKRRQWRLNLPRGKPCGVDDAMEYQHLGKYALDETTTPESFSMDSSPVISLSDGKGGVVEFLRPSKLRSQYKAYRDSLIQEGGNHNYSEDQMAAIAQHEPYLIAFKKPKAHLGYFYSIAKNNPRNMLISYYPVGHKYYHQSPKALVKDYAQHVPANVVLQKGTPLYEVCIDFEAPFYNATGVQTNDSGMVNMYFGFSIDKFMDKYKIQESNKNKYIVAHFTN